MSGFDVPIVFCTFNRLECTKKVFERIREIRPTKLYLVSDGARDSVSGEKEKVNGVRKYIETHIDWDCHVYKNFAEKNMGCGKRMSSGISWAFEQEEKLIILEDDCQADLSFFRYCEELLERYKDNESVMLIAGYNPLGTLEEKESFIFTPFIEIWGWATWKRTWQQYDYDIVDWKEHTGWQYMSKFMDNKVITQYSSLFDSVFDHKVDTWDYQLQYLVFRKGALAIVPSRSMVRNIGFGVDATHTKTAPIKLSNKSHTMEFPLKVPSGVENNAAYNEKVLEVMW